MDFIPANLISTPTTPGRSECLAYALADDGLLGIWAGTTTAERRKLRRQRAA